MNKLLVLSCILLVQCSIDRSIPLLSSVDETNHHHFVDRTSSHHLRLCGPEEPGSPLHLCLTFVDKATGEPLKNQAVSFYHTNTDGEYQPSDPSDESTARIRGEAVTNDQGRIMVETILPGDYGSSTDNRHIHTNVNGAHPEAYDIHFRQYSDAMGRRFTQKSDQHFLANLHYSKDSVLVTYVTIEVKRPRK